MKHKFYKAQKTHCWSGGKSRLMRWKLLWQRKDIDQRKMRERITKCQKSFLSKNMYCSDKLWRKQWYLKWLLVLLQKDWSSEPWPRFNRLEIILTQKRVLVALGFFFLHLKKIVKSHFKTPIINCLKILNYVWIWRVIFSIVGSWFRKLL